jgi:M3 family oligoendopeptidase
MAYDASPIMEQLDFHDLRATAPDLDDLQREYDEITRAVDAPGGVEERVEAVRRWNDHRKANETWDSLVGLHYNQDTRNEQYKRARDERDERDELKPRITELDAALKRTILESPHRGEIAERLGEHLFHLWEADVAAFDPAIKEEMVSEAKLGAEYTALRASAAIEYQGETWNLSGLAKFREDPDRQIRRGAVEAHWNWFTGNGEAFDRIFDDLVRLRTAMAKKLGYPDYVSLAYKLRLRVDYDEEKVERFRAAVREHVVPLCGDFRERQAEVLGLETLAPWDEMVHDPKGNPKPQGDHDWLLERAQEMFDSMGHGLDDFFRLMVQSHLLDLKTREGKAGGGFCTDFPDHGVPFIFANFNGTKGDVEVFTHEMGHAFQGYLSREKFPFDYLWPTSESCEIHSMGLEFLTYPHMELFFGEDADRFRTTHLRDSLLFLPYGTAVDHFQHELYRRPEASPDERHALWRKMERTYLPHRTDGGIERLAKGGFWQQQIHIYQWPFYYIDYVLAQICALQFWVRAEGDREQTMKDYVALCLRGGEAPFLDLARSAGLKSPFEEGTVLEVVHRARSMLGE